MAKTVVMVCGSAYSGSSLLSVLMDRIVGVVSVGEGARAYRPGNMTGPCATCPTGEAADCELYSGWKKSQYVHPGENQETFEEERYWLERRTINDEGLLRIGQSFYEYVDESYPDDRFLVDSTKDPTQMLEELHKGKKYPCRSVFLSKTPIEAFNSYKRHPREMSPQDCVLEWLRVNWFYTGFLQLNSVDVHHVHYKDLCISTEETLGQICSFLECTHSYRSEASKPHGHILGGNPAVSSVVSGVDEICFKRTTRREHMGGKYADVDPTADLKIAYDTSHRNLGYRFLADCQIELDKRSHQVLPVLQILGYGPQEMRLD